ncbi:protein TonB [Lutibacter oricola]|uniref:Protein TonB n=1 Tax=Lutibacter oricola TaxID=762486 RepID=A0A1H2S666_9FLAO|nr:energy transducer TonB [Lutibacter oricola]SDW27132.1 protein TonB [Lutibacter oricola]
MEIKKYPDATLENYSKILIQLGLVLSLFLVYEFMTYKSYQKPVKELTGTFVTLEEDEQIVDIKPVEVEVNKQSKVVIPDKIVKVDDEVDVVETIIESTETDESDAIIVKETTNNIVEVEEEEVIVEDVPFVIIENVPVFPGCTGNNKQLRACFSDRISKFVSKRFNVNMATELGLQSGSIQRIYVMFKIDHNGNITNIMARAPHKKLKEEAVRVIKLLPTMAPGRQRGKAVGVKYGLPIVFKVE